MQISHTGHIKNLKSSNLYIHYVRVMLLTSCHSVGQSGSMKETMRKIEREGKRKSASCLQEKLKMSFLINVIASCG